MIHHPKQVRVGCNLYGCPISGGYRPTVPARPAGLLNRLGRLGYDGAVYKAPSQLHSCILHVACTLIPLNSSNTFLILRPNLHRCLLFRLLSRSSLACSWLAGVLTLTSAARCLRRRSVLHSLFLPPSLATLLLCYFLGRCFEPVPRTFTALFEMRPAEPAAPADAVSTSRHNGAGGNSTRLLPSRVINALQIHMLGQSVAVKADIQRPHRQGRTRHEPGSGQVSSVITGPSCASPSQKWTTTPASWGRPLRPARQCTPVHQCTPTCLLAPCQSTSQGDQRGSTNYQ